MALPILKRGQKISAAHYEQVTRGAGRTFVGDVTEIDGKVFIHKGSQEDSSKLFKITDAPEIDEDYTGDGDLYFILANPVGLNYSMEYVNSERKEKIYLPTVTEDNKDLLVVGDRIMAYWSPSLIHWTAIPEATSIDTYSELYIQNVSGSAILAGTAVGIGDPVYTAAAWKASTAYATGQGVWYQDYFWTAKSGHTSGAFFDESLWDKVDKPDFIYDKTYKSETLNFLSHAMDGWCVVLKDAAAGDTVPAAKNSPVAMKIEVTQESATHVDISTGNQAAALYYGMGRILWKEAGAGTKWARVYLGDLNYKAAGIFQADASAGGSAPMLINNSTHSITAHDTIYQGGIVNGARGHCTWYPFDREWKIEGMTCP